LPSFRCGNEHDFSPAVLETIQNNSKSLILDTEEEFPTLKTKPKTTTNNNNEKITAASLSKTLFKSVGSNESNTNVSLSNQIPP
jgi:hypothetical protein